MEPRAHHLIIGLFTILAFAAALIFSLWLAKSSADRDWGYYEIVFDHAGVVGREAAERSDNRDTFHAITSEPSI